MHDLNFYDNKSHISKGDVHSGSHETEIIS